MAQHSRIGASTCERWWNCPGSVREIAKLPPALPSPYADQGTVAHLVGEWCLRTGRQAYEFVGRQAVEITKGDARLFEWLEDARLKKGWTSTANVIEVTEEMTEAVQVYVDTVRADMLQYQVTDIKIEHRFHLTSVDKDAFGTNDCNLEVPKQKLLIVYDYKHGQGISVDADENKQLQYYALGACQEGVYHDIEVVIVQPRAAHKDGPVRRWRTNLLDLMTFADQARQRIATTKQANAPLAAGVWCKKSFCPALPTCPAVRQLIETQAQVVFQAPEAKLPKPEEMSRQLLVKILDNMELFDQWLRAVEAYAETLANHGEEIPGYKLVRGRQGNRKWHNEDEVATLLIDPKYWVRKLLSPAQIEKIDKDLKPLVEKLTIRTEGKIILVPESDPREAVSPQAIDVFKQQDSIESLL